MHLGMTLTSFWHVCAQTLAIEERDIMRVLHVDYRPEDIAQEELECLLLLKRQGRALCQFSSFVPPGCELCC